MKELSIEQKARRYDEAIERANNLHKDAVEVESDIIAKTCETIFPELEESEDKRIREWIKNELESKYVVDNIVNNVMADRALAWLGKQGEQKPTWSEEDENRFTNLISLVKCSEENDATKGGFIKFINKLKLLKPQNNWKPGNEKKLTNEPKFKVGDWIISDYNNVAYIESISETKYNLQCKDGHHEKMSIEYVDRCWRPWTITDVKPGDVLYTPKGVGVEGIFLIEGWEQVEYTGKTLFSGIGYRVEDDKIVTGGLGAIWWEGVIVPFYPATKEQCDTLFERMKEEGYEWNADKLELKKIEQKPVDKVEPKFKVGEWYQCTKDFFGKGVTFDKNTAYYCAKEGCLQNEYGCHIAIVKDMYDNFKVWTLEDAKGGDILIDKSNNRECPFIFKETKPSDIKTDVLNPLTVLGYCGIGGAGFTKGSGWGDTANCIYYPATKEQRDQLEKAIIGASYEWNAEKLELKKIEHIIIPKFKVGDKVYPIRSRFEFECTIESIDEETYYGDTTNFDIKDQDDWKLIERKPIWSEEDERMITSILGHLERQKNYQINTTNLEQCQEWLKSLKDRVITTI